MSRKKKKDLKLKVAEKLSATLTELEISISSKKFKKNVKKASKALLAGLKVTPIKKAAPEKKKTVAAE